MDWINVFQNSNMERLTQDQREALESAFKDDLYSRMTRLEQIDDLLDHGDWRHTGRDGYTRCFIDGWSTIIDSTPEIVGRMYLHQRIARLENMHLRNQHHSIVEGSTTTPWGMDLFKRIVRLERKLLFNPDITYPSRPISSSVRPVDRSPPDYRPKIESPWKFVKPSEYIPSPSYKPLSDYTLYDEFFKDYGFMPYNQLSIPDEEKHKLITFQHSIKSYLDSMSAIAGKYNEVKTQFRSDGHKTWNTPFGQKYTQLQSDELKFLKLVFYELAKIACRRIIISSVHSIEDDRLPVPHSLIEHNFRVDKTIDMRCLYRLIKESEIVNDHRSSLLSPSRLRQTALRRALSKRIIFTVRHGSPISIRIVALKTDRLKRYMLPQVVAPIHQAVKIQECHSGYCDINTARDLYRQFYDKYKELTPEDFSRSLF